MTDFSLATDQHNLTSLNTLHRNQFCSYSAVNGNTHQLSAFGKTCTARGILHTELNPKTHHSPSVQRTDRDFWQRDRQQIHHRTAKIAAIWHPPSTTPTCVSLVAQGSEERKKDNTCPSGIPDRCRPILSSISSGCEYWCKNERRKGHCSGHIHHDCRYPSGATSSGTGSTTTATTAANSDITRSPLNGWCQW